MLLRFLVLFLLVFFPIAVRAEEVIHNYNARIEIQNNGGLLVTETIEVTAEGREIKRGIYRDFPLYRHTFLGGVLKSDYSILSVKKNGMPEQWHTRILEPENNNLRVYIGQSDVFLDAGRYVYEIRYSIPDQVFFFDDYDELYWNAIGTGWIFPIEKGHAEIVLPNGAHSTQLAAYTGKALSREKNYTFEEKNGVVNFDTTTALRPYEGLTIAVAWPKGFVTRTPDMVGTAFFWKQHPGLPVMLVSLIILILYYYSVWNKFGRDPKSRGLAPFYTPPEGISPAMAAMIQTMGDADHDRCMTATVVSLGSKGYITIEEIKKRHYVLKRVQEKTDRPALFDDERILYNAIGAELTLSTSNRNLIKTAREHAQKLNKLCHKTYYLNNTLWWILGMLMTCTAVGIIGMQHQNSGQFIMSILFALAFGWITTGILMIGIKKILFGSKTFQNKSAAFALILIWFAVVPLGILGFGVLAINCSWLVLGIIMIMASIVAWMREVMKAPTKTGREMMDHINGLQYYMEAVEEKVLQKFDPPQMSRELYEKYLPYAVALNVESKWAKKFAVAMGSALAAGATYSSYPYWYRSHDGNVGDSLSIQSMVNSFSTTLAAASTSESSGSSGGGSSGGGGGGGGGGGW